MSALAPNNRTALTDALRPPPGYVLEAGVGTTFSLDFDVFTAVLLAFVGADLEDERPEVATVLAAVARLRSRLAVYVNAGGLHPPAKSNRLFALYDRITHSVALDGSAFHPKVWALKFVPQATPEMKKATPLYRLLCASRNVTNSGCWELGARFEGKAGKKSELGVDVSGFLAKLARTARPPTAVWKLVRELPDVEFERGRETEEGLRFHWQWPGGPTLKKHLPEKASRALLISPFVRTRFVEDLLDRTDELVLVSKQEELDALPDSIHERLAAEATTYVVTDNTAEDLPGVDLHAKLLAWQRGTTSETLIGSANGTGAGWGLDTVNCEALVALRPGLRIDEMVRSFITPRDGELCPWIEEYERHAPADDPEAIAARRLQSIQRRLATIRLRGTWDGDATTLTLRAVSAPPLVLPEGVEAALAPLLQADSDGASWKVLWDVFGGGLCFEAIQAADLCAFAVIRLRDTAQNVSCAFGVQFELNLPSVAIAQRDEALNAKLLENVDPHAMLLNVLRGLPAGSGLAREGAGRRSNGTTGPFLAEATVERVMEACTADASLIDEVDALLSACKNASSMASFVQFWDAFKTALQGESRG